MPWLYDKKNKKFVLSEICDNFKELPIDDIIKIGYKNIQKTIKFINKKKLNNHFLHTSVNKIKKIDDILDIKSWDESEKSIYHNPLGLWIGYGDSWLQYVKSHIKKPSMWNLFSYVYDIEVNESVLIIESKQELYNFINKFKNDNNIIKIYNVINWKKVRETYNGLIIIGNDIWNTQMLDKMIILGNESVQEFIDNLVGDSWKSNMLLLSEWVRHWETKTGVIWSKNGIKEYKLIKKISFNELV